MSTLKDFLPPPTDNFPVSASAPPPPPPDAPVIPSVPSPFAGVSKVLALPRSPSGHLDYSAVVRQGENASRTLHTTADALVEKSRHAALRPLPSTTATASTTARTRAALEAVVAGKIAASQTRNPDVLAAATPAPAFVRYTPANANRAHNVAAEQRIIKMVEAPVDPMLPPRFAHRKAPVNPPSPPVPVMHSPERKLSKAEADHWRIPPVVSNWKNNRGYTISLEKRLAADARNLQDHSINDRFASMADALYKAERCARDDVEKRAQLQRRVALRAKEAKEKELRELADRARRERKGYLALSEATDAPSEVAPSETDALQPPTDAWLNESPSLAPRARRVLDDAPPPGVSPRRTSDPAAPAPTPGLTPAPAPARRSRFADAVPPTELPVALSAEEIEGMRRRDEIRRERREARERDMRQMELHGGESTAPTLKRSKLSRDQDRDLAERVALGQGPNGGGGGTGELQYDQRLFNQGNSAGKQGALAAGYGADDAYNLYDKPLFNGGNASSKFQYRPPRDVSDDATAASRGDRAALLRASKGEGEAQGSGGFRDRPVEFERDGELKSSANEDLYGLDKFFNEAKQFEKGKEKQ